MIWLVPRHLASIISKQPMLACKRNTLVRGGRKTPNPWENVSKEYDKYGKYANLFDSKKDSKKYYDDSMKSRSNKLPFSDTNLIRRHDQIYDSTLWPFKLSNLWSFLICCSWCCYLWKRWGMKLKFRKNWSELKPQNLALLLVIQSCSRLRRFSFFLSAFSTLIS